MQSHAEFLTSAAAGMSPEKGADILKRRGWLANSECEFQDALLRICQWRTFQPHEALVTAGDQNASIMGIAAGTVSVTTALGPPDTPLTHIAHPGLWVGLIPLVGNRPTDHETVARTRVYAAVTTQSAARDLLKANPAWWQHLARFALHYGDLSTSIAADLLIRESDRRCAAALLRIADCRFAGDTPTAALANQAEIASIANLSRNTTSIMLRQLEQKRIVARQYNRIDILAPAFLRALADGERAGIHSRRSR